MKKIIAFSGSLRLSARQLASVVTPTLANLSADEYITGAAIGVDAAVGEALTVLYPHARHTVIIPGNRRAVDAWWTRLPHRPPGLRLITMPETSSYRDRNAALVKPATELIAYPQYPEQDGRSRRSGTWQTIRLARNAALPVTTHILSRVLLP